MNELDPTRAALLALDFQNYGVHPQGYWASHGEPDWPAIARPAVDSTAKVLAAARRHRLLIIHVGVAWRPGSPEMNMTARSSPMPPTGRWRAAGDRNSTHQWHLPPVSWSSTSGG